MKPSAPLTWQFSHCWLLVAVRLPHALAMFAVSKFVCVMQPDHCASRRVVACDGVSFGFEPEPEPPPEPEPTFPPLRTSTSLFSQSVILVISSCVYTMPLWPAAILVRIAAFAGVKLPTTAT